MSELDQSDRSPLALLPRIPAVGRISLESLDQPPTETLTLTAVARGQIVQVQQEINRVATILELEVIDVEEKRHRLNSELRVTLTGLPDQIAAFRASFHGASGGGGNSGFNMALEFLLDLFNR